MYYAHSPCVRVRVCVHAHVWSLFGDTSVPKREENSTWTLYNWHNQNGRFWNLKTSLTLSCDATVAGPPRSSLWRNADLPFFFNNCNKKKRKSRFILPDSSAEEKKRSLPSPINSQAGVVKNQGQILSVMLPSAGKRAAAGEMAITVATRSMAVTSLHLLESENNKTYGGTINSSWLFY